MWDKVLCSAQYEAQVQLLKEDLSRKEAAAQRRVERVQRECQAVRNELRSHVSDKQRVADELEQLKLELALSGQLGISFTQIVNFG